MAKRHLKRYFAPKTWNLKRKEVTFVTRQNPGSHPSKVSVPLNIILRDMLHYANSTRESKSILIKKEVLVDGKKRNNHKFCVGLFDIVEFKDIGKSYRVIWGTKGKLGLVEIGKSESNLKPCKIINKTIVKGKTQLNLNDGKNILVDKDVYKTGDTIFLDVPKLDIKKHLSLKKDVLIYLTGGKHIGEIGKIKDVVGNRILCARGSGDSVETLKKYAFVIGDDKSIITLSKKD